ncbi:hypothetical protein ACFSUK_13270 [Sphingobium scionense]
MAVIALVVRFNCGQKIKNVDGRQSTKPAHNAQVHDIFALSCGIQLLFRDFTGCDQVVSGAW